MEILYLITTGFSVGFVSSFFGIGGGVITDLGGFVACTFKRGIKYINIPTSLLSMVDASVGGKTGVDLGVLKNQIGLFANPEMVLVDAAYLETVTPREIKSGIIDLEIGSVPNIKINYTNETFTILGKTTSFN